MSIGSRQCSASRQKSMVKRMVAVPFLGTFCDYGNILRPNGAFSFAQAPIFFGGAATDCFV